MMLDQAFHQRLYYYFDCCIFYKLEYAAFEQSVNNNYNVYGSRSRNR
jgi:hypothetical protein